MREKTVGCWDFQQRLFISSLNVQDVALFQTIPGLKPVKQGLKRPDVHVMVEVHHLLSWIFNLWHSNWLSNYNKKEKLIPFKANVRENKSCTKQKNCDELAYGSYGLAERHNAPGIVKEKATSMKKARSKAQDLLQLLLNGSPVGSLLKNHLLVNVILSKRIDRNQVGPE